MFNGIITILCNPFAELLSRSPRDVLRYYLLKKRSRLNDACSFCAFHSDHHEQVLLTLDHVHVVRNIYAYKTWDGCPVEDHLMIVPRRHVVGLTELNQEERDEWFQYAEVYEKLGYSVYARAPKNSRKSVVHQHTHLIKTAHHRRKTRKSAGNSRALSK